MRRSTLPRSLALTLIGALALTASSRVLFADDAPAPAAVKPAEEAPAADSGSDSPVKAEPELFEDVKLIKVDATAKTITVLIPPDKAKSGRAYRRLKLAVDDNSLIMLDQQPSTMSVLQEGMLVNVSHMKKGKTDTVDTIVVRKQAEPE